MKRLESVTAADSYVTVLLGACKFSSRVGSRRVITEYEEIVQDAVQRIIQDGPQQTSEGNQWGWPLQASCSWRRDRGRARRIWIVSRIQELGRSPLNPTLGRVRRETLRICHVSSVAPMMEEDSDAQRGALYVTLVYTPTNASWLNPIESIFSGIQRFVFNNSDFADHSEISLAIRRYSTWRNSHPSNATMKRIEDHKLSFRTRH